MDAMRQHYLTFETAAGFCGIAWTDVGISCLRLPSRSADSAGRALLRRIPEARPETPQSAVAEAVVAVKRYFEVRRPISPASSWTSVIRSLFSGRFMPRRDASDGAARPPTAP